MSNRAEAVVMFLACAREGLACNPVAASHLHLQRDRHAAAAAERPCAADRDGWGADRSRVDLQAVLAGIDDQSGRLHAADAADTGAERSRAVQRSRQGRLPRLHLRHDRHAQVRDALRQLAARPTPATWRATGATDPDTVLLSLSPLSHHIAWVGIAQWLLVGCRLVSNDPPGRQDGAGWIIDTRATYVMGVPTHAMDVLAQQKAASIERMGRCAVFYMAGAPIPPSVAPASWRRASSRRTSTA
jgi:acyl-CoA synthetase